MTFREYIGYVKEDLPNVLWALAICAGLVPVYAVLSFLIHGVWPRWK